MHRGSMHLRHPTVGAVSVDYQVWLQPDSPDHRVEIYTANDPASSDAVRVLTQQSGAGRQAMVPPPST